MNKKLSLRVILAVLVIISFLTLAIPTAHSDLPENYINISCFTQNNLSLDYLRLIFIAFENNSVVLEGSALFQAVGNRPTLTINVDSSGPTPISISGDILSDVAFYYAPSGINRNYFIGYYYEKFAVNATTANKGIDYNLDFSNNVERAMNAIRYNGSIENVGIRGTLSFEVKIRNPVGIIKQARFLNVILEGSGNLSAVTCDFTIPEIAQLKEATNGNQNMQKVGVPYRVGASIGLTPTQSLGANLYLEWEMPEETPFLLLVLYHPYFLLFLGCLGGVPTGYVLSRLNERRQKKSFGTKLISELEAIKQDLGAYRPINTRIYDSLTSRLLLFCDGTAEIVKRTYEEVKRSETTGYTNLQQDTVKELLDRIDITINALKKEIGKH